MQTDEYRDHSDLQDPTILAIRRIMSEYDRSTPPVQPAIPFDTPMLPNIRIPLPGYDPRTHHFKDYELNKLLMDSYNHDSKMSVPFLEDFAKYERKRGQGRTIEDLSDLRIGQWLFMYAVLQSLPMVVVDAPNLQYTNGVEYFLCVSPRGGPPWVRENGNRASTYYGTAGGTRSGTSTGSDYVTHSVEAIYHRSHCWEVALKWAPWLRGTPSPELLRPSPKLIRTAIPEMPAPIPPFHKGLSPHMSPYQSPYASPHISPGLMPVESTYEFDQRRRSSVQLPSAVLSNEGGPKPVSAKNFDEILATMPGQNRKKK